MRIELFEGMRGVQVLAQALGARSFANGDPPRVIGGVATDSREVLRGDLFVCLEGEHTNGACYISQALEKGAVGVLAKEKITLSRGEYWCFAVDSPLEALLRAAAYRREKSRARVVAVTGSAGKTTVKEAIAAVLGDVPHSEGNFNSLVGMPLSVLSLPEAEFWVLELGINHKGEMQRMVSALRPNIGVLTNVGSAHIGNFKDYGTLLFEKTALARGLQKDGCFLFPEALPLPLSGMIEQQLLCVGGSEKADFRVENIVMGEKGVCCDLHGGGRVITNLSWSVAGEIGVSVISLAGAVGILGKRSDEEIREGLRLANQSVPRMKEHRVGERLLLDDSYNASPEAVMSALQALRYRAQKRPAVAILGDMLELGEHERSLHEAVGRFAAGMGLSRLFTYGSAAAYITKSAIEAGMSEQLARHYSCEAAEELCFAIEQECERDAVILFKGSRKMGLEKLLRKIGE